MDPDSHFPVHSLRLSGYHAISSLQEGLFCGNSFPNIKKKKKKISQGATESQSNGETAGTVVERTSQGIS